MKRLPRGFTVLEILMTFVIIGILATLGIVGFREIVQNNRAVTLSNSFIASLAYARSEAIQRASPVTVCAAANNNLLACGNNGDWTNGWIVFLDPNGDGTIANNTDRLKVHEALEPGTQFNAPVSRITYNSAGFLTTNASVFNIAAANCTGNNARQITVTTTGRTDIVQTSC